MENKNFQGIQEGLLDAIGYARDAKKEIWIWVHKSSNYTDVNFSTVFFETKEDAWEHFLYDWDQARAEWDEITWADGYMKEDSREWERVEFHQLKPFKGIPNEIV